LGVSVFPAYRQAGVFPTYGRQASFVPISKENKATGVIADIHKIYYNGNQNGMLISLNKKYILLHLLDLLCVKFSKSVFSPVSQSE
jgi:hypothetical protein